MKPSFPVDNRQSVKYSPLCRLSRGHMKKTQTDLLQGALDLLALKTLQAGPTHGPRYCATHTAGLTGCIAGRPGITISGAAPAGGARLDCFRMGRVGERPEGEILQTDGGRTETNVGRDRDVEAFYRSSGTDSEDALNERIWPCLIS